MRDDVKARMSEWASVLLCERELSELSECMNVLNACQKVSECVCVCVCVCLGGGVSRRL